MRRKSPSSMKGGRFAHARPARARAQEIRPAGCAQALPVLEALIVSEFFKPCWVNPAGFFVLTTKKPRPEKTLLLGCFVVQFIYENENEKSRRHRCVGIFRRSFGGIAVEPSARGTGRRDLAPERRADAGAGVSQICQPSKIQIALVQRTKR